MINPNILQKKHLSWAAFLVVIIVFLIIIREKILAYSVTSDENIYYYMARLVAEGKLPYRDFFFAHPPLHLLFLGALTKIAGHHYFLLKITPLITTLLISWLLFMTVKDDDLLLALGATALFLFTFGTMMIATQSVGLDLTLFFMMLSFFLMRRNQFILSGIAAGLASVTGLYSFPFLLVLAFWLFFTNRAGFLRYVLPLTAIFFLINLSFFALSGKAYLEDVYTYHLLKESTESNRLATWRAIIMTNPLLFFLPLSLFFVPLKKKTLLPLIICLGFSLFFLTMTKIFLFYFNLMFPFLALLAMYGIVDLIDNSLLKNRKLPVIVVIILLSLGIASITFHTYYEPPNREKINELFATVNTMTTPEDTLFGDSYLVPLVATVTKRTIAGDLVDTNNQRFNTGMLKVPEVIAMLKQNNTKLVILQQGRELATSKQFQEFLTQECRLTKRITDEQRESLYDFIIFDCSYS
ncbi:hypothetical protein HYW21_08595 [Candidatus Woesearchaeota archaeon]|nr:hypothetical protein [Candidatus Woesearchaeota archaeon]